MSPPPPPSHILSPHSKSQLQSKLHHDDIHKSHDAVNNSDKLYIVPNQHKERIKVAPPATTHPSSPTTTRSPISSTPTPSHTTPHHTKPSSSQVRYKHSPSHRRTFRSSFPRLPHAFAQPSTNRYLPYIPISITVRQRVERKSIVEKEDNVEEEQLDPVVCNDFCGEVGEVVEMDRAREAAQ